MPPLANTSVNYSNESSSLQNVACDTYLHKSLPARLAKTVLCVIILLFSLAGNALIITIVRKRAELRNTINYFIVNMAVSDHIYPVISIPVHFIQIANSSGEWPIDGTTGLIFCKLQRFLEIVAITVSIQSLFWIALDRFVAVVLPMKVHLISSRFRIFAIASTWVVAIIVNYLVIYAYHLVERNGEIVCFPDFNNTLFSYLTYSRVYSVVFQILPLVAMTMLYIAIAVTLRRHDKALQCRTVHQKDQRKRRAIKMSFFIMSAFYICALPIMTLFLLLEYEVELSCSVLKALWFLGYVTLFLSSVVNPVICVVFIQNYRLGLKEIFRSRWRKRLSTSTVVTGEQEGITLQDIKDIPWMAENPVYVKWLY